MSMTDKGKHYICIDLKSFYASVECAERGLNPFETNLVVADVTRGKNALCLCTISDSIVTGESVNAEQRQVGFSDMIRIALETA